MVIRCFLEISVYIYIYQWIFVVDVTNTYSKMSYAAVISIVYDCFPH